VRIGEVCELVHLNILSLSLTSFLESLPSGLATL